MRDTGCALIHSRRPATLWCCDVPVPSQPAVLLYLQVLEERLAKSEMIDYDWGHNSRAAAAATEGKSIRSGIYTTTGSDEDSDFEN